MTRRLRLKITASMLLLVTLMASFSLGVALYLILQLQRIDHDYSELFNKDARATVLVSAALFDISEASRLVYGVMTRQDAASMKAALPRLERQQHDLQGRLEQLRQLLTDEESLLAHMNRQQQALFRHAGAIVDAAARWRGDRALEYIDRDFDPLLHNLRTTMEQLRSDSVRHFEQTSQQLTRQTRSAIHSSLIAVGIALLAALLLSGWWSLTRIARPVNLLTRAMQQLTWRNYDHPIAGSRRHDELGQMARALEVFRDTMKHADYLEEAKTQAEQLARTKSAFLATMSHEIRTPLNAVIGLTLLALRRPLADDQRQRLEQIRSASQHLLGVINNILDFSKMESGHMQAEQLAFSPQQLVEDVHTLLQSSARDKSLLLHCEYLGDLPVLLGDPLRIRQILLNYGNNAIKFSERGNIDLQLWHEERDGQLFLHGQVSDQGIGLCPEQTEQLFKPFQQADASISRRFGGTGLGLAICRSLAELMGGTTGVLSQDGAGSTFWFYIRTEPASTEPLPVAPADSQRPEQLSGLRLLLVDDNVLNRIAASEILQDAGILADQADSGERCLDMLQNAPDGTYQAVLMDMMMPGLDGCATTRLLRQNPRFASLPVIALTANTSREDRDACLKAGMNELVGKPVDEHRLWAALLHYCLPARTTAQGSSEALPAATQATPTGNEQAGTFNPAALQRLQQRLTAERFTQMLELILQDGTRHEATARQLAEHNAPDLDATRQLAHDLISMTGHLGLTALQQRTRQLQRAAQDGDSAAVGQLLLDIAGLTRQSMEAIRQHFLPAQAEHP